MDSQNDYLVIMNKHNRKIVERAYHNSFVNAKYKFPKNNLAPQAYSEVSQSISLCSRVSEIYDLHQKNAIFRDFHNASRKIAPLSSILKIKPKANLQDRSTQRLKTLFSSRTEKDGQKLTKRQYLSLTPNKDSAQKNKKSSSIQKTTGINLTRRKQPNFSIQSPIKRNPQNQSESLLKTLHKMTERCFGNNPDQNLSKQSNEVIFFSDKLTLNEQELSKRVIKIKLSDKLTADSTPIAVQQKTKSTNYSKHKRGMSIVRLREKVTVSPFSAS